MTETVVVSEIELAKGAFGTLRDDPPVTWVSTRPDEKAVSRAVRDSGARIAVLGATRYSGELYDALAEAAHGGRALIARFGVGYDGIDVAKCAERRILLTITRGALDQSVAEHAIALLLAAVRGVASLDSAIRAGRFAPRAGFELAGKTLCIAGFGSIGGRVAAIASGGFGMRVVAFGRRSLAERCAAEGAAPDAFLSRHALSAYFDDYEAAAGRCDALSVHMPATAPTHRYFDAARLSRLRPEAVLVNTSRGRLIDEVALYRALADGGLRAAALDVFVEEPYAPQDPACDLRTLPNVVMTPHVGSNTAEANANMRRLVCADIGRFLAGRFEEMNLAGMAR